MKQIFIQIQQRLATQVPALKHIDKNWNQLNIPQPPVKFPCALIDLDNVEYSQAADRCRLAEASITLTIADHHTVRSSANAPSRSDAFGIFDVIEMVIEALEGFRAPSTTQALTRTRLQKTFSDQSYDIYSLTFSTAWVEQVNNEGETAAASPSISVRLQTASE